MITSYIGLSYKRDLPVHRDSLEYHRIIMSLGYWLHGGDRPVSMHCEGSWPLHIYSLPYHMDDQAGHPGYASLNLNPLVTIEASANG